MNEWQTAVIPQERSGPLPNEVRKELVLREFSAAASEQNPMLRPGKHSTEPKDTDGNVCGVMGSSLAFPLALHPAQGPTF